MIQLSESTLSLETCLNHVRTPRSGALAVFIGTVREISEGRRVSELEYEAYEPMALEQMQRIVDDAHHRWTLDRVALQHRTGSLQVGDDAVIVAVSAEHRQPALEACRYIIDRVKESVPIWKKEQSEAGSAWVPGWNLTQQSPDDAPER